MNMKRLIACALTALICATGTFAADVALRGVFETGFTGVLSHKIKFGNSGTDFDYVDNGGQDVLFPVTRFSLELDAGKRHTFILLYQPLRLETQDLLKKDETIDGLTFPASTGIRCVYGFPFYRASWLRDMLDGGGRWGLALGLSLQIRNASISFESIDGTRFRSQDGIGPVPALKMRTRVALSERFFAAFEADGMYAPVSYLNGSDNEIVGAILDASVRAGMKVREAGTVFLNVRYLGGGATGTSTGDVWPGDGYVKNWLHFLAVSTGCSWQL
jgi:hypothetical protein